MLIESRSCSHHLPNTSTLDSTKSRLAPFLENLALAATSRLLSPGAETEAWQPGPSWDLLK
jgi:hypothetical protein